jgi:two-component system, OmpR family, response regulator VanR
MIQKMLILKDKSVLYAEDDLITRTQTAEILEMLFAHVYTASDGEEGYRIYEEESPDILITDIKMPKCDGMSLIRRIRSRNYTLPIILMSSFAEQELLLNAANLSIDGYLVKPIELEKLTAAICKAIQRTDTKDEGLIVLGKNLFYNSATKELYLNGAIVTLGVKEQDLLSLFLNNRHKTITKEEIAVALWPLDPICESAIKNIILRLRRKLGIDIIVSVRGIGYRLDSRETTRIPIP